MFIHIEQDIQCSNCGSRNYESFISNTEQGLRCKNCGHENVEVAPRITASSTTVVWDMSKDKTIKF